MNTDAEELLDDLGALRRRARQDQRGYWLPLLLFGLLILIAPLLYRAAQFPPGGGPFVITTPRIGNVVLDNGQPVFPLLSDPNVVWGYWMAVLVVGVLVTFGWYRLRAARAGVQPHVGVYLAIALGSAVVLQLSPNFARPLMGLLGGLNLASVLVSVVVLLVGWCWRCGRRGEW